MGKDNSIPEKLSLCSQVAEMNKTLSTLSKQFTARSQIAKSIEQQQKLIQTILNRYSASILTVEGNNITTKKDFNISPIFAGINTLGSESKYVREFLAVKDNPEQKSQLCKEFSKEISELAKKFVNDTLTELNKTVSTVEFYIKEYKDCQCSGIRWNYDFWELEITNFSFVIDIK